MSKLKVFWCNLSVFLSYYLTIKCKMEFSKNFVEKGVGFFGNIGSVLRGVRGRLLLILGLTILASACSLEGESEDTGDFQEDVVDDTGSEFDFAEQADFAGDVVDLQDQVVASCLQLGIDFCVPADVCMEVECDPDSPAADEYGCRYMPKDDGSTCTGDDLKKDYACEMGECVGTYKEGFVKACYEDNKFLKGKRVGGENTTHFYDGFIEDFVPLEIDGRSLLPPGVEVLQPGKSPWDACVCYKEGSVLGAKPDICLAESASCNEKLLAAAFKGECDEAFVDCEKPLTELCSFAGVVDEDCVLDKYQEASLDMFFDDFPTAWYESFVALQPCPRFDEYGEIADFSTCVLAPEYCDGEASSLCLGMNSEDNCFVEEAE